MADAPAVGTAAAPTDSPDDAELRAQLHAHGLRATSQRTLVLRAVRTLRHATPETISTQVRQVDPGLNPSTVYRTLELFERIGLVRHTHLGPGAATYHSAEDHGHLHLVCEVCGSVDEVPSAIAAQLVGSLEATNGFQPDVEHMAITGTCAACSARAHDPSATPSTGGAHR
jgi:Fur family ferric uptake transcriptional regulator